MFWFTVTCVTGRGALPLGALEHSDGSASMTHGGDEGGRLSLLPVGVHVGAPPARLSSSLAPTSSSVYLRSVIIYVLTPLMSTVSPLISHSEYKKYSVCPVSR